MSSILPFFIVITAGLVFSEIFKRLHLPYVTALIIAGLLIGPYGLNLVQLDDTINFIGAIGIVFLMFIAGSEIKLESLKETGREVVLLSILNGLLPFLIGLGIGFFYNYGIMTSLILGTVFISSSVGVVIPTLESSGLIDKKIGKTIVSATIFEDIVSLILLALILQSFTQKTPVPLPLYVPLIFFILVALKVIVTKLEDWYLEKKGRDLYEGKLRFVFVVLLATVALFEFIGMHSIVAGFIIGILLGDSIEGKVEHKIRTISYGLFIPTFFLVIGMRTDLSVFSSITSTNLIITVVLGLILSKILSGLIVGNILKYSKKKSFLIGFSTIPQLSTTLAVSFSALELELISQEVVTSLVILSIVTTFTAPLMVKKLSSRIK